MRSGNPRFPPPTRFELRTTHGSTDLAHERLRNRAYGLYRRRADGRLEARYSVKALHTRPRAESVQMGLPGLKRQFLSIEADEGV
jgi:hypothetical protein